MRAVVVHDHGGPDVLVAQEPTPPEPGRRLARRRGSGTG